MTARVGVVVLPAEQQKKLDAMIQLHRGWQGWQAARLTVMVTAAAMLETGLLTVADVCQALQVSPSTWQRYARIARPLMLDAAATIDGALREAGAGEDTTVDDVKTDPDFELALASVGVHHRVPAKEQGNASEG
jgi:hypothetical protein